MPEQMFLVLSIQACQSNRLGLRRITSSFQQTMAEKQDRYMGGSPNRAELHHVLRPAEMKAVLDVLLETRL